MYCRNWVAFCLVVLPYLLCGQKFDVEEIVVSGPKDKRINLVFVGDGYKTNELDLYISDVKKLVDETFVQLPFSTYKEYFNVYAIKVPSNVSGAAMNPNNLIDNYFGSSYGVSGIDRLLVPTKSQKVTKVLADNFPEYDQIFVVVNHSKYGGSGGKFATSSTNSAAGEVAIHEIGHSFAGLADEYWFRAQEKDNQTSNNNPQTVRWKNWMNFDGVGIYEHSGAGAGNYKPHKNCKMQFLGRPFCAVCKESFTWKIHDLTSPIESFEPESKEVEIGEDEMSFSLNLLEPKPNTLQVKWLLNANLVKMNSQKFTLKNKDLKDGSNVLEAKILDTTALTRRENHPAKHTHIVKWDIKKLPVGIWVQGSNISLKLEILSNPVDNMLKLRFANSTNGLASFSLFDINGRNIYNGEKKNVLAGSHFTTMDLSGFGLNPGVYIVRFNFNGNKISQRFIKN